MRAFRVNLFRGGDVDQLALAPRFHELAGWHLEVYLDARDLPELAPRLAVAPRLVIDHLGHVAGRPAGAPGARKGRCVRQGQRFRADRRRSVLGAAGDRDAQPRGAAVRLGPPRDPRAAPVPGRPTSSSSPRPRASARCTTTRSRSTAERRRGRRGRAARAGSAAAAARRAAPRAAAGRAGCRSSRARGRRGRGPRARRPSSTSRCAPSIAVRRRSDSSRARCSALGAWRATTSTSSSPLRRWAERQARRTTRSSRSSSETKASSRSAIGCSSTRAVLDRLGQLAQRDLAQRAQVLDAEEAVERGRDPRLRVDLAGLQAGDQVLGREVDEHDLVRLGQLLVGHGLAHLDAGQLGHLVVERLEVLDVDGGEDVDAGVEDVLDVLVALRVLEARARWCARARRSGTARGRGRGCRAGPSPRAGRRGRRRAAAGAARGPAAWRSVSARPWVSSRPITTSRPASASAWASASIR